MALIDAKREGHVEEFALIALINEKQVVCKLVGTLFSDYFTVYLYIY